jgi:hypothetical protein
MTLSKPTGTKDMTRREQEGHIFLAIAAVMPEIRQRPTQPRDGSNDAVMRLEDVLLALGEKYAFDGTGMLLERQFGTSAYDCAGMPRVWQIGKDLYLQSDECVAFIASLLPETADA